MTRFDRFCLRHRIKTPQLARLSGFSPQYINGARRGSRSPTLTFVAAMVKAARQHTGDPSITANQLFELDDDDHP